MGQATQIFRCFAALKRANFLVGKVLGFSTMTKAKQHVYATEKMTPRQRGSCHNRYLKEALDNARPLLKTHNLKCKSHWLYRVEGTWFFSAFIRSAPAPQACAFRAVIEVTMKSMASDPIFWAASGLSDNINKPASFRCNAVSMLQGETFPSIGVASEGRSPEDYAPLLLQKATQAIDDVKSAIGDRSYSQFLEDKGHPKLQIITYVTALMADGRLEDALRCIEEELALYADPTACALLEWRDMVADGRLKGILDRYG